VKGRPRAGARKTMEHGPAEWVLTPGIKTLIDVNFTGKTKGAVERAEMDTRAVCHVHG
jgi:hypothetical protein